MRKCLYCYQMIEEKSENADYHASCAKKIFAQEEAPQLEYRLLEIVEMAKEVVARRISVPGVQAKLSLCLNKATKNETARFTIVGLWGNFILKPPTAEYRSMPEVEDCTMRLASLFKIDVVEHSLIRLASGELAYITRRIDRNRKSNEPIHMEDFCQLSEKPTSQKYRSSMENVAKIIRRYSSNYQFDMMRLFEVTLFSFLTGNADMHLKNFSLLHNEEGYIVLTPAYDLLATRLFLSEKEDPEEMALTLNGKKRKLKRSDFYAFGLSSGLSEKQIENAFKKIQENFPKMEAIIRSSFIPIEMQDEYIKLINERARILL